MSGVPPEIAGLGSSAMVFRVTPGFDPLKAGVTPDEYFVLSRIDGKATLRDVLLSTGLEVSRAIAIVTKLRTIGALLAPNETTPPKAAPPRAATPPLGVPAVRSATPPQGVPASPRTKTPSLPPQMRPPAPPVDVPTLRLPPNVLQAQLDAPTMRRAGVAQPVAVTQPAPAPSSDELPAPTAEETAALAEDCELGQPERRRILAMARLVAARDPHALLGVPRGADPKLLKRTYFKLSKEVHPDRFYGKQLGSFRERLATVFEAVSRAYEKLTSPEASRSTAAHQAVGAAPEQPQTPTEYAAELFDRACQLEVGGDALEAMKLFAAAVRVDGQTRYLRRAASCALAAGQPKTAVEYAKKAAAQAPDDVSAARLLAAAFRAAGKLADAEEVLVMAMAIKSENDVLAKELRKELADVRRLLAASGLGS